MLSTTYDPIIMKTTASLLIFFLFSTLLFAQKKEYNIGILLDNHTIKAERLLKQFKNEIQAVVGEDAIINFKDENVRVNYYDLEKAKKQYQELVAGDTDIIIALGPINGQIIYHQDSYAKPTILFGSINTDLFDFDLPNESSGTHNFTYFIESKSFKTDITTFKELTGFKKVGVAVVAPLAKFLGPGSKFSTQMSELAIDYKLIPFNEVSDIISNTTDIDAIYMAGGFFLSQQAVKQLADAFIKQKLPSFTINGREDVAQGFMATHQNEKSMDQLLRRIAISIDAYVSGTNFSELPTYINQTQRLAVNYNTALLVGVPLKYSLIGSTDFVGEFINPVSEKQYHLLTAIDAALEKNLLLQSSEKDVLLSKQALKTAKSDYLPHVTASGTGVYVDPEIAEVSFGRNPEFSTNGNVTLKQLLFSEAANTNITIKNKLQKAQQEIFKSEQLDLILETSTAYFTALILKVNVRIQMQNLSLTKSNLQIAEQIFEMGQSGKSDVLRFKSEMAQNMQTTVEAVNQLEQGFVLLNQVLNNAPNFKIDVEDIGIEQGIFEQYKYAEIFDFLDDPSLREPFIDFLVEEALYNAPELKSLDYNKQAIARRIKLNRSGRFLPTLALQGQYDRVFNRSGAGVMPPQGFNQLNSSYNVGFSLSIPVFNQNKTNINKKTSMIEMEQLAINQDHTELSIAANVRNSVLDMVNQVSNIQLSKVAEQTALEALHLTQDSYASGAVTIVQLLDAQRNYLNSQLISAAANYNYLLSSLTVERTLGYYFLFNTTEKNKAFHKRFFEFLQNKN